MNLTAENTAIVLDSTADLPDAADRFPNWRVVPLYVRFGDESCATASTSSATEFYERLRELERLPHDLAADAGRLPRLLRGARRLRADLLAPHPARSPAPSRARAPRREQLGDGRVRAIDTETASASIAMLALAIQRRLERGTSDEEIDELVERYRRERGLLFTVDTLEFLAARRPHRQGGGVRRDSC